MPTSTNEATRAEAARVAAARTRFALETLGDRVTPRQRAIGLLHLTHPDLPPSRLADKAGPAVTRRAVTAALQRLWDRAEDGLWLADNLGVTPGGER